MNKRAILVFALCVTPAFGSNFAMPKHDHLFPELSEFAFGMPFPSVGSPKDFPELYTHNVVAREIADVSFVGSFGLGIVGDHEAYRIVSIARHGPGEDADTKCETPINKTLALQAIAAWRAVLLGTRFSDDVVSGADGASYHFSMMESFEQPPGILQHQPLYGWVWAPDPGTAPHRLVELAAGLGQLCRSKDGDHKHELTRLLTEAAGSIVAGTSK